MKSGVDGKLSLTLSDGIYVDTMNIQPAVQNQIRRMAAVSNPVFYKNMAMGLSNYDNARWIYMGKEHLSGYIEIPRGLYDELTEQCRKAGKKDKSRIYRAAPAGTGTGVGRNAAVRYRNTKRRYSIWKNGCVQRYDRGEKSKHTHSVGIFVTD